MSAREFFPARITLRTLRAAAAECKGCDLYLKATQTVFGEGPKTAPLLMIGEQPGDREDIEGKPFVGPAGRLLDEAVRAAGLARDQVYVTNAVKHSSFEERGKRRLHKKPSSRQVSACRPWLEAEIQQVKPKGIICLGATAAQALLGRDFRLTQHRGEFLDSDWAEWIMATYHPSALLRAPDEEARAQLRQAFAADLRKAAGRLRTNIARGA